MTAGGAVRLRALTVVDDGDDVLLGDPATGTFVAVPAVGGVVVRALLEGATTAEAGDRAAEFAGEPVDVEDFLSVLAELGFLAEGDPVAPVPTAPVQQRGWTGGPPAYRVRPFFSRPAWCVYAAAAVWVVGCFLVRPDLWPRPADAFVSTDLGVSLLVLLPLTYVLVGLHEAGHWLAARALGLQTRFGLDRRLFFLVFETDLSQLWSVPRRSRYGPQLAGLAVDAVVLSGLLAAEIVAGPVPLLPALVFVLVVSSLWQCLVFLRTDLYGVLVTATGCRDLWRVKSLLLRQAFGRLDAGQRAELDRADPRDVSVGRWFRWVWLAGYPLAAGYLALFYLPLLVDVARWAGGALGGGPGRGAFWSALAVVVLVALPPLVTLAMAAAERRTGRRPAGG
jgi:putative peptide zinc metalloprotease protein